MVNDVDETNEFDEWLKETEARHKLQNQNIKLLENAERLDENKLRSLDSTLKKVTTFMKKLKQISSAQSITSLSPEVEKLNLSKYLDEFATSICEAKLKIGETAILVNLCVKVSSLYATFPELLLAELKKHVPSKKTDKISNASKLRVDLKFLSELVLNGVFKKDGLALLGSVLSFLVNTDKTDHVNVSILLPMCKTVLFDLSILVPTKIKRLIVESQKLIPDYLSSSILTNEQKQAIAKLLNDYYVSLVSHLNETRLELNKIQKSIKRQERTKGDASIDDRQKLEQVKQVFDRLLQNANDLAAYIGEDVPPMPEEPSDDEEEITIKEDAASIWPDFDTQTFYESLIDVNRFIKLNSADSLDQPEDDQEAFVAEEHPIVTEVIDSIDAVDMSSLEDHPVQADEKSEPENAEDEESESEEELTTKAETLFTKDNSEPKIELELQSKEQVSMSHFLERLYNAINRELIDKCATDFVSELNRKGNRKRLVQHILSMPTNRLDLLPFLCRFLATIRPAALDVPQKIVYELLSKFRSIAEKKYQSSKSGAKKQDNTRIDAKIHICSFIGELVKFNLIPKAEALACLRTLLVDLRGYKVDMLSTLVESTGTFLYRSPESYAKMNVILQVMREKNQKMIKDPRQQILLDNAYFAVIPPDESFLPLERRPPLEEFIQMKIGSTPGRGSILRRIDWSNKYISEYTLKILSNPTSVRFSDLEKLASLVGLLSDYHDWIGLFFLKVSQNILGVHVVDSVLEFIRLAFETANPSFQQRLFSSIKYIGELYNYNLVGSAVIFKVFYQLITFSIADGSTAEELARRVIRVRLVCELMNTVGEFFLGGSYKKKMDIFLHFFLNFFYDTKSKWNLEIIEEIGDFPHDMAYLIDELLHKWRKGEQFANNSEEAQQRVKEIEKEYKTKVEEILQGIRIAHDDEEIDDERRLNCIMEDDEEEDLVDPEERAQNSGSQEYSSQLDEAQDPEEEQIRVHKERKDILPEDEDFMRDFDRVLNETFQMAPINLRTPFNDLEVPPAARQKFERKLCFETDTSKPRTSEEWSLNQPSNVQPTPKIALMTRGKKGTVLKAVHVETSESMEEAWKKNRENRERERKEVKKLTLKMNERMRLDDEEDHEFDNVSRWPKLSGHE